MIDLSNLLFNMQRVEDERYDHVCDIFHKLAQLEKLTGYSLDDLLRLFAAGWTLQPPSTTAINLADYTQEER